MTPTACNVCKQRPYAITPQSLAGGKYLLTLLLAGATICFTFDSFDVLFGVDVVAIKCIYSWNMGTAANIVNCGGW